MSCLGVHFALSHADVDILRNLPNEAAKLEHVHEVIEENYYGTPDAAASDKSWDALHRTLSDGYLNWTGGEYPLNHTVLAGELLYSQDDHIMSLKTPSQVRDISQAISNLTEATFKELYYRIPAADYDAELSDEDLEYTWSWFQDIRALFGRAAQKKKFVLFTADQ